MISHNRCQPDVQQTPRQSDSAEASLYFRWLLGDDWAEHLIMAGAVITPATIEWVCCTLR